VITPTNCAYDTLVQYLFPQYISIALNKSFAEQMSDQKIQDELPLTPLTFQILLALADQERHGYGVIKEIEIQSGGSMAPATGALYLAAQRMLESQYIEESEDRPDPELDDRRRKYYRLTAFGRSVAAAEAKRMVNLVGIAFQKRLVEGLLTLSDIGVGDAVKGKADQ
jgi:DNA-binding PadR family transcriptional regulator